MSSVRRKYFGTDGIRGPANVPPLVPEFVTRLAGAAARVLAPEGGPVLMIRDPRQSGQMLLNALSTGLLSAGHDVLNGGVLPTPAAAILGPKEGAAFSIVVSASHNPAADNGIKFFQGDGTKLSDEQEAEIEALLEEEPRRVEGAATGSERILGTEARDAYVDFAVGTFGELDLKGMTIALDGANGAAFETSVLTLEKLGAKVLPFHCEPDGININEACGCTHPEVIAEIVRNSDADLGISHDGDADRVLFVDEKGESLDGDEFMGITALHFLSQGTLRGDTLVATKMSNAGLDAAIQSAGGNVLRTDVGDRHVSAAMRAGDHNLGGEQSGHFVFSDFLPSGDGLVSALQLLRVVQETGQPLSELRKQISLYPQILLNIKVAAKPALEDLEKTTAAVSQVEDDLAGKGRVMLRYSGTESLLRVLVEGEEESEVERMAQEIGDTAREEIKSLG